MRDTRIPNLFRARKQFKPEHDFNGNLDSTDLRPVFRKEVEIMKKLSGHSHIVSFVEAFLVVVRRDYRLNIIIEPAADSGNLSELLRDCRRFSDMPNDDQFSNLVRSFGCLASAMAWIHNSCIPHKDIAPNNVIIHKGNFLISDFGGSHDFAGESSITDGEVGAAQMVYRAPEVVAGTNRSRPSDIWSLGCVFVLIISVLDKTIFRGIELITTVPFRSSKKI